MVRICANGCPLYRECAIRISEKIDSVEVPLGPALAIAQRFSTLAMQKSGSHINCERQLCSDRL